MTRVIGLISGTSVDGIDAALVDISGSESDLNLELVGSAIYPYPADLRSQILAVCGGSVLSMAELAELDDAIAIEFSKAALTIEENYGKADLIGSHGQTVYHRPPKERRSEEREKEEEKGSWAKNSSDVRLKAQNTLGYSLQLGRGAVIAHLTGLPTVSNFRAADIAVGGQGAPLVPIVDASLLSHPTYNRCIQNLGGIGNVTYLPCRGAEGQRGRGAEGQRGRGDGEGREDGEDGEDREDREDLTSSSPPLPRSPAPPLPTPHVLGWDTGPGNSLLDLAVQHFSGGTKTYDKEGVWAASGTPSQALVEGWLQQEFFHQQPPKSTGRELFGSEYLHQCLAEAEAENLSPADVLATLVELTATSIVHSYRNFLPQMPDQVLLCGGGSRNLYLKQRLRSHLAPVEVLTTSEAGLNADFKEAIAFAVLAYWRSCGIPGNLPEVTGAVTAVLLGEIHHYPHSQA